MPKLWKRVVAWLSIVVTYYASMPAMDAMPTFAKARVPGEIFPPGQVWIFAGLGALWLLFLFAGSFFAGSMLNGADLDMKV